eukprot:CAMPEP_0175853326 /NCGR_PEP_ID=MMETSP0107_2-20121207/26722_1 /TAXON_ID=195067 ORGANISM="Goniomonas pacifica, Strain CCMP1869" /NCGR_SAMPLE_ID=MMETSP0107_2 /ASSEMBLY_ACC=CAM_ASM_000203 /LENGTH=49 /DNA_ID=CAMNT_0017168991 /DNA_START=548 /DNA_END=697 /DNA_ORIENTATION=+
MVGVVRREAGLKLQNPLLQRHDALPLIGEDVAELFNASRLGSAGDAAQF